jgi:hypothetical protein
MKLIDNNGTVILDDIDQSETGWARYIAIRNEKIIMERALIAVDEWFEGVRSNDTQTWSELVHIVKSALDYEE